METDLLRTFTAVARSGNFTAAARELGYAQSTVTSHLQALERRVGARLLDRLPMGAVPTEAGFRLLPLAQRMLDLEAGMVADVSAGAGPPAGRVRLVAPESMCAYRLPALVLDLRARAPELRLTLAPAGTADALTAVRTSTTDVALALEPELESPDLLLEALGVEELTVLCSPADVEDDRKQTPAWADLVERDILLLEDGCSYSDDVDRHLRAAGQPDSRRTRFGSIEAVKQCVAAGLGWSVLPTMTVAAELRAGTLVAAPHPQALTPTVHLATHPDRTATAATRLVLERLRALWP